MPFPDGVPTRSVSVGAVYGLESGAGMQMAVTFRASRSLIWDANGYRFDAVGVTGTAVAGGAVSVELPVTDAEGWRDQVTNSLIDVSAPGSYTHRYVAEVSSFAPVTGVRRVVEVGPFIVPTGEGVLDLDEQQDAGTVEGDVSLFAVLSGAVAAASGSASDAATSAADAAGSAADAATSAAAAGAAKVAAEDARDGAVAAQAAAEAVGSTNDTIIAAQINTAGSQTEQALKTTFVGSDASTESIVVAGLTNAPGVAATSISNINLGARAGRTLSGPNAKRNIAIGLRTLELGGTDSADNVAIGPLQAMGTTEGVGNVAIGFSALGGAEATNGPSGFVPPAVQNYNVVIGYDALIYGTDASSNVAIGQNAMTEVYSGQANVAVGSRALRAVKTTSVQNVAIGPSALDNGTVVGTTSRGHNVAIGAGAMLNASGADVTDNIAIGAGAGTSLQARNSVLVGRAAGLLQTTAKENTAIGFEAMLSNVTSEGLTAIGASALRQTTGAGNTGIGNAAGQEITTGSDNTAVGRDALRSITTGAYNTAIGKAAGQTDGTTATTNGFNRTLIGWNAQATADHVVVLGAGISGWRPSLVLGDPGTPTVLGNGVGVVALHNAATVPNANHPAGGHLYVESGALKWRGGGGTVTTLATA